MNLWFWAAVAAVVLICLYVLFPSERRQRRNIVRNQNRPMRSVDRTLAGRRSVDRSRPGADGSDPARGHRVTRRRRLWDGRRAGVHPHHYRYGSRQSQWGGKPFGPRYRVWPFLLLVALVGIIILVRSR